MRKRNEIELAEGIRLSRSTKLLIPSKPLLLIGLHSLSAGPATWDLLIKMRRGAKRERPLIHWPN